MGESQSRYSIVERLIAKKLDIMGLKSSLKETVKSKEQYIEKLNKDLENWKIDIKEDVKRQQRQKELAIQNAMQDFTNSKSQTSDKELFFDEQVKAIEKALTSIEEISKTSQP